MKFYLRRKLINYYGSEALGQDIISNTFIIIKTTLLSYQFPNDR